MLSFLLTDLTGHPSFPDVLDLGASNISNSECDRWVGTFNFPHFLTKSSPQYSLQREPAPSLWFPLSPTQFQSLWGFFRGKVLEEENTNLFSPSMSPILIHRATEPIICLSVWCKWEGIMLQLLMRKQCPSIFQVSGAEVLLRSQHWASKVHVFPRQWVGLATKWFAHEVSLYLCCSHN